ncbi:hypothetical protein ACLOJK_027479, partial [Asimina triloba]
ITPSPAAHQKTKKGSHRSSASMAAAAPGGLIRGVFEGCIRNLDTEIERRPYHRKCGCALHAPPPGSRGGRCKTNISYPLWPSRSRSSSSLQLVAAPARARPRPKSRYPSSSSSVNLGEEKEGESFSSLDD